VVLQVSLLSRVNWRMASRIASDRGGDLSLRSSPILKGGKFETRQPHLDGSAATFSVGKHLKASCCVHFRMKASRDPLFENSRHEKIRVTISVRRFPTAQRRPHARDL
jgi:hypothetical protein